MLTTEEKIRLLLKRKDMTISDLSEKLGTSRQNMTNKLKRNNFTEKELKDISSELGCSLVLEFENIETKERI